MEELKELDELFKKGLENARVNPPAGVWEGIASSVSTATTAAGQTSGWLVAAKWFAGVVLTAGLTYIAYTSLTVESDQKDTAKNGETAQSQQQTVISSQTPENTGANDAGNVSAGELSTGQNNISGANGENSDDQIIQVSPSGAQGGPGSLTGQPAPSGPPLPNLPPPVVKNPKQSGPPKTITVTCKRELVITATRISGNAYSFFVQNAGSNATWYFGDDGVENGIQTSHEFSDMPAVYMVKVRGTNASGCMDSALEKITVTGKKPILMNAFTPPNPNGDGFNDEYFVDIKGAVYYNLVIYDMQGRQVFSSNSIHTRWNGKCGAIDCPAGEYQVTFAYKYPGDEKPVVMRERLLLTR